MLKSAGQAPLLTNHAIVLGMLMIILGLVFYTSSLKQGFWSRFYDLAPNDCTTS